MEEAAQLKRKTLETLATSLDEDLVFNRIDQNTCNKLKTKLVNDGIDETYVRE
jgi:hypothetical protein